MKFVKKIKLVLITVLITAITSTGIILHIRHNTSNSKNSEVEESLKVTKSYTEIIAESLKLNLKEGGNLRVATLDTEMYKAVVYEDDDITMKIPLTNKEITINDPSMTKAGWCVVLGDFFIDKLNDTEVVIRDENNIDLLVPYPTLDEKSTRRKADTFKIDEKVSTVNFDGYIRMLGQALWVDLKETMDARAVRKLEDKIDTDASSELNKVYSTEADKIYELETKTLHSMESFKNGLIQTILNAVKESTGSTIPNINIKLKESKLPEGYTPTDEILNKIEKDLEEEN